MFIKEIFDGKSPDDFDEETLVTITKFFEKNNHKRILNTNTKNNTSELFGSTIRLLT